ncbi:MCE family protein [Nocardioides mangrovicus]|uniref:MCE family protein n=1 Tax=Nocardioides mangrovicus TaxID=2478913 RepID=A0A3L8P7N6_9ACTN|nr:MCE family protein [Nocardioides mangrovicus]
MLDKKTRSDGLKLLIFIVVTSLATGVLVVLIGNFTFGAKRTYKAEFADATGVTKGDDVRIAGVKVGSVKSIAVYHRTKALVTFSVLDDATVTRSSTATIRYRNLVGQRYISLTQGIGDTSRLPDEAMIPLDRTQPALDLTVLLNGFKPLFAALSPSDINKLSYEVIQVFQGEGGNIEGLLADTASLTQTLASKDKVIGELIDNLNAVLSTVAKRDNELSSLIVRLRQFVGGLKDDRQAILGSLDSISDLTDSTAGLLTEARPPLANDVTQLKRVTANLNQGAPELDRALQVLPIKLTKIGRTAIYGSFFNFYLCQLNGTIQIPSQLSALLNTLPLNGTLDGNDIKLSVFNNTAARCSLNP